MDKAIGIVRVSGPEQMEKYGPEAQRREIEQCAETLGLDLVEVWQYQESATDSTRRPEFNAMLQRLVAKGQAGEIQAVVFGRPDRLGRDGEAAFFYYLHLIEVIGGVSTRFARDDVDRDDPFRNFQRHLHSYKATTDAKTIRANTMGGRQRRAVAGRMPTGNVPWPFDYSSKVRDGRRATGLPTVNDERAKWVRQWAKWILDDKLSLQEICRRTESAGVYPPILQRRLDAGMSFEEAMSKPKPKKPLRWTASNIHRILKHRSMLGEFWCRASDPDEKDPKPRLIHSDPALAILTEEEYQRVQAVFAQNQALAPRNSKYDYTPAQGFVYCHCGRKAAGNTNRGKFSYWRCQVHRSITVNVHALWNEARERLTEIVTRPEEVLPTLKERLISPDSKADLEARRTGIIAELADLEKAFERVIRMFAILEGYGEEKMSEEVGRIRDRRGDLERDLEEVERGLRASYETEISASRVREVCERLSGVLENATREDWRGLMRDFNFRIILQPEPPHLMRVSVQVQEPGEVVLHGS